MAEEYERRGVLGEDGDLGEGGEVRDRGLFGGHHGRRSELEYGRRPGLPYEPGAMAYGEPGYGRPYEGEAGYGRPGAMPYGEPGYGPPGAMPYGQPGYGPPGAMAYGEPGYGGMRRPEVVYVEGGAGRSEYYDGPGGGASDLGTGLIDSNIRTHPDYGSSLMRPDMTGVPIEAYERRGHHGHHDGYMEEEFDEERRRKRYAEAAAAATLGYGLHERHEKQDLEERLEELGYDSEGRPRRRQHHGLFRSDS